MCRRRYFTCNQIVYDDDGEGKTCGRNRMDGWVVCDDVSQGRKKHPTARALGEKCTDVGIPFVHVRPCPGCSKQKKEHWPEKITLPPDDSGTDFQKSMRRWLLGAQRILSGDYDDDTEDLGTPTRRLSGPVEYSVPAKDLGMESRRLSGLAEHLAPTERPDTQPYGPSGSAEHPVPIKMPYMLPRRSSGSAEHSVPAKEPGLQPRYPIESVERSAPIEVGSLHQYIALPQD
jgi:hypothetical protein